MGSQKAGVHNCAEEVCSELDLNTCCEVTRPANCDSLIGTLQQCTAYDATFIVDVSSSICQGEALNEDNECENFEHIEHFVSNIVAASTKESMVAAIVQFSTMAVMKLNHGNIVGPTEISNAIEDLLT